jgi:hypothetical protein
MRPLPLPSDDPGKIFQLCVGTVRDNALRLRLTAVRPAVEAASLAYDAGARAGTLYALGTSNTVQVPGTIVTKEEMGGVYDAMVRKSSVARPIYNRLIAAPVRGVCPLCGQRRVSTLDHHLPQSEYPALVVAPTNLVPSCSECNRAKLARVAANADEQTLHPYFDVLPEGRWLQGEVVKATPPCVRFFVLPPATWSPLLAARVQYHLSVFALGTLYASHAAEELVNIRVQLLRLFERAGSSGVQSHLRECAESRLAANPNSWQAATYEALAGDAWFCTEGFALVA